LRDIFEEYLTDECKTFLHMVRVLEEARNPLIRSYAGTGRIPCQYQPFIRTLWAKCFFKITTTTQCIKRLKTDSTLRLLCGFYKVPGTSMFSRNFTELSGMNSMRETLDRLVKAAREGKVVYHVGRDSTAIAAREAQKGGASLKTIDTACAHGCKKNSHGAVRFWTGYKPHLDISDTGFPLSVFVSGANVHDSQLATPLEKMTENKVFFCYRLMGAAYDTLL
jgi:transposase